MVDENKEVVEKENPKKVSQFNNGGIARGCGAVAGSKRKVTKYN